MSSNLSHTISFSWISDSKSAMIALRPRRQIFWNQKNLNTILHGGRHDYHLPWGGLIIHKSRKIFWIEKSVNHWVSIDIIKVMRISNFFIVSSEGEFHSKLQKPFLHKPMLDSGIFSKIIVEKTKKELFCRVQTNRRWLLYTATYIDLFQLINCLKF